MLVLLVLGDRQIRVVVRSVEDALTVVLVPPRLPERRVDVRDVDSSRLQPAPRPTGALPARRTEVVEPSNAITLPTSREGPDSSGIDWDRAAQSAATAATTPPRRGFGMPESKPKAAAPREFGWDRTHTERIHAIPGGGIGIRINDNCEIAFVPLPIGGCALGKRKARGDLFEGMKDPDRPAGSVPDVPH